MAIINNQTLSTIRTSIKDEFAQGFADAKAKSFYEKVASVIPSSSSSNTYGFLGSFPKMRKWTGIREVKSTKEGAYILQNEPYESTLGVKRSDIEDDNLAIYRTLARLQAEEANEFFNYNIAALLTDGESNLCYDEQNYFDKEHPVYPNVDGTGTATLVSNIFGAGSSTPWYLLCADKPLKPLILQERKKIEIDNKQDTNSDHVFMYNEFLYGVYWRGQFGYGLWQQAMMSKEDLTPNSLDEAHTKMSEFKRDGNSPMGIVPTHLVVPPTLRSKAEAIVNVATNAAGAGNIHYKRVEIIVCPYL